MLQQLGMIPKGLDDDFRADACRIPLGDGDNPYSPYNPFMHDRFSWNQPFYGASSAHIPTDNRPMQPTPAIVTQETVGRFPRWALWLFCTAYILPGFLARHPWKRADITAFGVMLDMARGTGGWIHPTLGGIPVQDAALLPYWIGAWAIRIAPTWMSADLAARIPFMLVLALTFLATWWAIHLLAQTPAAQPVALAFGGDADPRDYSRSIADGGLLALLACLGLAHLAHETTPALVQLGCASLLFLAVTALPTSPGRAMAGIALGTVGMGLSGTPGIALAMGAGAVFLHWLRRPSSTRYAAAFLVCLACAAAMGWGNLGDWGWRWDPQPFDATYWKRRMHLLVWFPWPAWPLAFWSLWRWRLLLRAPLSCPHLLLPLWFIAVGVAAIVTTPSADRVLLLTLPAWAALAAFALPTLGRSLAALIDWFTLLFFSGCALVIWIVWIALQTGHPFQPVRNVARLAPGFTPTFSFWAFAIALLATGTWALLVRWRTGRHRNVLWTRVVLPAGGATLCWLLLMTLWMPLLDYARSYVPLTRQLSRLIPANAGCVATLGLSPSQTAALQWHTTFQWAPTQSGTPCDWLLVNGENPALLQGFRAPWFQQGSVWHPVDRKEILHVFHRRPSPQKLQK
ncbi:glycosyltransferase-like protein [Candidatus Symbiobacter mobilis CR]|uniref:Glycosyltransferase-like protein n=2 Tax=Candidatus Symbiobacter TaxID=1436289 RepID=U5N503_9BURK|nr:glycosyltransferase-like protein [Candidatus Symbiobacter mobilis CR]